jgi:hypothetical protein
MSAEQNYWFPAKRYGWGWGLPIVWQGWAVLGVFSVLMVVGSLVLLPAKGSAIFAAYSALLCVLLVAVCWRKGEPPRWRWGNR